MRPHLYEGNHRLIRHVLDRSSIENATAQQSSTTLLKNAHFLVKISKDYICSFFFFQIRNLNKVVSKELMCFYL